MSRALLTKALLLLLASASMFGLWRLGLHHRLDLHTLQSVMLAAGPWGPVFFVLVFSLLQPLGLSAHVFLVAAGLIWPPQVALPLAWLGMMSAAATSFGFSRYLARGWVQPRIPARLRRYDGHLERSGFRTVLTLRLIFFTTSVLQWMLGISRVRFASYLLGTALGNLPLLVIEVLMADRIAAWWAA